MKYVLMSCKYVDEQGVPRGWQDGGKVGNGSECRWRGGDLCPAGPLNGKAEIVVAIPVLFKVVGTSWSGA